MNSHKRKMHKGTGKMKLLQCSVALLLCVILGLSFSTSFFAHEAGSQSEIEGEASSAVKQDPQEDLNGKAESEPSVSEQETSSFEPASSSESEQEKQEGQEPSETVTDKSSAEDENSSSVISEEPKSIPSIGTFTNEALFLLNEEGDTIIGFSYDPSITPTEVEIPEKINGVTITAIGENAFAGIQLQKVSMPDTILSIGDNAFLGNPLGGGITLSKNLQSIGNNAFSGCYSLSSIEFPESLQSIGDLAFSRCTSLISIVLPQGLKSVGEYAFWECTNLTSMNWPASVGDNIGPGAFSKTNIENIVVPEGVTQIPDGCFKECRNLKVVSFPQSLESIGRMSFFRGFNSSQEEPITIAIPANVKTIDAKAFEDCARLVFDLSNHEVNSIPGAPWGAKYSIFEWKNTDDSCFWFDSAAQTLIGLKEEGHTNCQNPLWHKKGKGEVVIPSKIDGVDVLHLSPGIFLSNQTIISLRFEQGSQITTIPKDMLRYSFLKELELPGSIHTIQEYAFSDTEMTSLVLPVGLQHIQASAFSRNRNLASLTLPEGLETIGEFSFSGINNSFAELVIPSTVTSIGQQAFASCFKLKKVTILGSGELKIDKTVFRQQAEVNTIENVYIQERNQGEVKNAPWGATSATFHWKDGTVLPASVTTQEGWVINTVTGELSGYVGETGPTVNLMVPKTISHEGIHIEVKSFSDGLLKNRTFNQVEMEEGHTLVPAYFLYQSVVKKVVLPSSITGINGAAFEECKGIEIELPENLEMINYRAFMNCELGEVKLPPNIKHILNEAFSGNNLTEIQLPLGLERIADKAFSNNNIANISVPSSILFISSEAFADTPGLNSIFIDKKRMPPLSLGAPWGAQEGTSVFFSSDLVEVDEKSITADGHARSIDLELEVPMHQWNITDVLLSINGGPQITLFSGMKTKLSIQYNAMENATYTFYVKTPNIPEGSYVTHTCVINDIGKMYAQSNIVYLLPGDTATVTEEILLQKGGVEAFDYDSSIQGVLGTPDFTFSIPPSELDKINDLQTRGDAVNIGFKAVYSNWHDLSQDPFKHTYDGKSPPVGQVDGEGKYLYNNLLESDILVKYDWRELSFDLNGGTAPEQAPAHEYDKQYLIPYRTANEPENPQKDGYFFIGWAVQGQQNTLWNFAIDRVAQDTTLVAQWAIQYTVNFDSNGATVAANPASLKVASPITNTLDALPKPPVKEHFIFNGWNTQRDGSGQSFTSATVVSSDMTVYAQWLDVEYLLSFNTNGGQGTPKAQRLVKGSLALTPEIEPMRAGFTFTGWNTRQNGQGSIWNFASDTMPGNDIELFAQWKENPVNSEVPSQPPASSAPVRPVTPSSRPESSSSSSSTPPPASSSVPTSSTSQQQVASSSSAQVENTSSAPESTVQDAVISSGGIPLGGLGQTEGWSILSLIVSLLSLFASIFWIVEIIRQRNKEKIRKIPVDEYYLDERDKVENKPWLPVLLAAITGLLPGAVFLILDDISNPPFWINRFTLFVLLAVVVNLLALVVPVFAKRKKDQQYNL